MPIIMFMYIVCVFALYNITYHCSGLPSGLLYAEDLVLMAPPMKQLGGHVTE